MRTQVHTGVARVCCLLAHAQQRKGNSAAESSGVDGWPQHLEQDLEFQVVLG